jgi:hypothetical protein
MKKPFIYTVASIVIVGCVLFSQVLKDVWFRFFPRGDEYGLAFNPERVKRGIFPIPENWNTRDHAGYTKTWKASPAERPHTSKIVVMDKSGIDSEVDYFSMDGYGIEIIYNYRQETTPWTITLSTGDGERILTKEQADSVLLKWGISGDHR